MAHWDKTSWQRACSSADTLSHTAMANTKTDVSCSHQMKGSLPNSRHSHLLQGRSRSHASPRCPIERAPVTYTLFLIRTTAGAPVGGEVVDQFLILTIPSATKTVPSIRNSPKERFWARSISPHWRTRTRSTSCTPASGRCKTMILRWTNQSNIYLGAVA